METSGYAGQILVTTPFPCSLSSGLFTADDNVLLPLPLCLVSQAERHENGDEKEKALAREKVKGQGKERIMGR